MSIHLQTYIMTLFLKSTKVTDISLEPCNCSESMLGISYERYAAIYVSWEVIRPH